MNTFLKYLEKVEKEKEEEWELQKTAVSHAEPMVRAP